MVKSEPPSAVIYLDDDDIGVTPAIITQVLPGKYKIKIKMEGYNSWSQSVDVKANKETSLAAVLQGKDCSVVIESKPTKAEIFIDGNDVGMTPVTIDNVKTGKHLVEVKLDGYEVWSKQINVETKKKTSLTAELITKYGSIALSSEPTKAKIFLDGIEVSTTPASLRSVPNGTHLVEVRMDGYSVWEKSVSVEHGKETVLSAILQVKTGSATIKSQPKNAKIYLDGKYVGTTPESIPSINPGTHEIKVEMDNYDVWTETVNIETGKENVITAVLQRSTGSLMVESEPANAVIFIDGKEIGHTPEIIMSSAKGTHTVEVRMDGYEIWKEKVDIEPGTEKSITATLQLKTGSLNINSKPSGGAIFLDGKETGTTPESLKGVELGTHQVEVKMDGYENWSESVEVSVDKENQITAVLQQLAGSLNIKSEPANAMIIVDDKEVGTAPANIANLKPGKYSVEVRMDGYENWSESVEVSVDKENQITAVLQQLAGSLNIKSEPANAMIIVDGKEAGTTPANIANLKPGKHPVEVRMEGYENWSESIEVSVDKENQIIAVLQQLAGSLNIKSKPVNAMIIVDGKEAGTTPANIANLKPGKHPVEVRMEGYENWSESIEVSVDKENQIIAVLQQLAGSLNIKSEPVTAMITVDGKEVGTSPANIADLKSGKHLVEVKLAGYENWSESVEIDMGKEADLTAVLQLKAGSFTINSVPSDAMISIDGKAIDTTPLTITDPGSGKHSVEVRMDGYETWSESVNIVPGEPISLTATLQIKAGTVSITSEPSDAFAFIDGKEVGRTPVIITDQSPGTHKFELKMDKYETWSKSVDIKPGKEVVLTAVLQSKAGSVNINSNPSNATAFVEGKEIGTTPVIISNSSPGTYLVEVRMDGYETWNESVNIEQGKQITITADLQMKAGAININSNPSGATIHIDGKNVGKTPKTITDLLPGMHLVEVKLDGHETWSESAEVKGDKENTLTAKLQKLTGSINIKSNPPEAAIYLDSEKIGTTPDTLKSVAIGAHEVEISMEGYAEWKKSLNIKKGKEITLNAVLQSNTGTASIDSDPAEAMVLLDGKDVGKTPVSLTGIKIGIYEIELQKEGYVSCKKTIKIKAGRVNSLTAKLTEMTAAVNITSEPSNAIVCIDGKETGNSPVIITDLTAGKHLVEIRMNGYEMWSDNVNIDPGKEITVTAELQIKPGSVSINSEPPNAMIRIDSKEAGTTPKIITDLSLEEHHVEVRMDGYEVWSESINIKPGIELSVVAELQMKAGSVSINSEPSNAIIFIDSKKAGFTPETLTGIKPGKHQVEVGIDGYETWSESVEVRSDKENAITAALQAITGSISIKSNPSDAIIFLDGEEVGTTPDTIRPVAVGTHEIEVKSEWYAEWKKKIYVKKGKEFALSAVLKPITGTINFESEPTEAMILLDGEKIGETPKTLAGIKTGMHEVEMQKDGYAPWNKTIKIKAGREYAFTAELQGRKGSLMIISNPSNATIYIEGKKSGRTPEVITELKPGNYSVEVKLDGYQTWSENADIVPGKETNLKAVLQTKPGSIIINSKPSDAKIIIDGNEVGTTPETIDIECGDHIVELMVGGYGVWSENVEVKANKKFYLTAVLLGMPGSISIKSEPSNATILIDGKECGDTPAVIKNLSPGSHMVDISIDGYQAWSESVEIEPKQAKELTAILQEVKGTVTINSNPAGALILIDGQNAGTTPETITDITAGVHLVEVSIEGYEDWSESINVVTDKEYAMTASLNEKTGFINVTSEPANATIFLNGNKVGSTPETIENLKLGFHQVEVIMDGYEKWSSSVEVTAEKQSTVTALLQKVSGSVNIKSTPLNAKIYVNGEEVGTTPATLSSIPIGTHEIEVKISGHEDWKKTVNIKKDKEISLNAVLQMNIGSINIESYPENAKINLDGKEVGIAPKQLTDVIVGTHDVEVLLDGYDTWKKTIKVKAEKEISLTADLKKIADTIEIKVDKESTIAASLQKETGSISITSTPSNSQIYLDGADAGTTPATLGSIPIGTHEIEIRTDGHDWWKKSIIIKEDKEISLNAVLHLNVGSINIESYPENAKINLDGKEVGIAPKRLTDVIVGAHDVEVLLDGYDTWKKTIKVKAEKEISLTADLEKIADTIESKADQAVKTPETVEPIAQEIPEKASEKPISQAPRIMPSSSDKKSKYSPDKLIKLRSTYDKILGSQIESLPYITINEKNNNIFFCHSSINHRYELKPIGDGEVVIDHTTELMWHQSGSSEYFNLRKANKWLKKTNKGSYAGFNDWRLPTLEEASTLLEFGTQSGKFIHTVFDDKQWGTWTGDKSDGGQAWIVTYVNGTISQVQAGTPATFVRPVRSLNI